MLQIEHAKEAAEHFLCPKNEFGEVLNEQMHLSPNRFLKIHYQMKLEAEISNLSTSAIDKKCLLGSFSDIDGKALKLTLQFDKNQVIH